MLTVGTTQIQFVNDVLAEKPCRQDSFTFITFHIYFNSVCFSSITSKSCIALQDGASKTMSSAYAKILITRKFSKADKPARQLCIYLQPVKFSSRHILPSSKFQHSYSCILRIFYSICVALQISEQFSPKARTPAHWMPSMNRF